MTTEIKPSERRTKCRFALKRELRYKVVDDGNTLAAGTGETIDLSSGGVGILVDQPLAVGAFIELSISWPVLLDENCPMRLIVFGRVVRCEDRLVACTVDKYEFRTQARKIHVAMPVRNDAMLQRWADGFRREAMKGRAVRASA